VALPERRLAFGDVAELYDSSRPSYPDALVDDVLAFARAGDALEVGAGTGRATALFGARGLRIHAIEPSPPMAALAQRNCAALAQVEIEQTDFERFDPHGIRFGLLYSAQAWHWVSPEVRYVKAAQVLAPGGTLALFWNRPRWEDSPLRDELRDAYRRAAPDFGPDPGPMHPDTVAEPELWGDWERELTAAPQLGEPEVRSYRWSHEYTTERYLRLLRTHSDHILLGPARLEALLEAVGAVLNGHGATIPVSYVTVLCLARALAG
jgi:SAM-dependent methyltransferase